MINHTNHRFDPLFLAQPYSATDVNTNYVIVTNDADGRTIRRHRDDFKLLPFNTQTQDDLAKCRDNDSNTRHYRSSYDLENYEDFARQIEEEVSDFERPFLFQDSCPAPRQPDQASRCCEMDEMPSFMENVCLDSASNAAIKTRRS